MTRPESYDELIRTKIRKMRPTKAYPYDPDFPYAVLNVFSDEGIARFRYESDAVDFAEEDLTMYVIDTTPKEKERPMTDIVNDLRTALAERQKVMKGGGELYRRAADEIERLRDVNDQTTAALEAAERRAEEVERELQVAEDQANNLAGDLAQAEKERDQLAAIVEKVRAADSASSSWDHFGHLVMDILATAPDDALREHDAALRAGSLREAAQEMDEIEAKAEIAEFAAYVEGETGRQSVIDAAAEMQKDPAQWVRTRADRIEREAGLK